MSDCIFCKMASGIIPVKKVYEDDDMFAIEDIAPAAPVHLLIITKRHIVSVLDTDESDEKMIGRIYRVASSLAKKLGIAETGFRIVNNTNRDGGQSVFHIHFHLLGGRSMQWPPG